MYPTIFHIPLLHIPIYGYGLMMVFAFLATQWLASKLAALRGLDPEIFVNVALIALVSGVIGSRASHVLENLKYYTDPHLGVWNNFVNMINIRSGGLTFYGGSDPCIAHRAGLSAAEKSSTAAGDGYCRAVFDAGSGSWTGWVFPERMLLRSAHQRGVGRSVSLWQQRLHGSVRCGEDRFAD